MAMSVPPRQWIILLTVKELNSNRLNRGGFLFSCLDLLNLCPQLLHRPVAVYSVRDVIPEAVPQHALAVRFPDAIALTQPALTLTI